MANTFSLGRNWQQDGEGKQYRVVSQEGRGIGRIYQHRFRFNRLGKIRNGFRFEFYGLPTRDPIIGKTLGEIYDRMLLLKRQDDAQVRQQTFGPAGRR